VKYSPQAGLSQTWWLISCPFSKCGSQAKMEGPVSGLTRQVLSGIWDCGGTSRGAQKAQCIMTCRA
jgi:hypothetical protein